MAVPNTVFSPTRVLDPHVTLYKIAVPINIFADHLTHAIHGLTVKVGLPVLNLEFPKSSSIAYPISD